MRKYKYTRKGWKGNLPLRTCTRPYFECVTDYFTGSVLTVLALLIHLEKGTWPFVICCAATRTNPVMPHALATRRRIPEMHPCFYYLYV